MATESKGEKAPKKAGGRAKRIGIAVLVVLAAVGIAYGVGRMQGAMGTEAAEKQRAEAEVRLAACVTDVKMLEARRQLDLALRAMDDRNFGIAQDHIKQAGQFLSEANVQGEVAELATQLKKTEVMAATNFEDQRDKVLSLIQRFDALLPPKSLGTG